MHGHLRDPVCEAPSKTQRPQSSSILEGGVRPQRTPHPPQASAQRWCRAEGSALDPRCPGAVGRLREGSSRTRGMLVMEGSACVQICAPEDALGRCSTASWHSMWAQRSPTQVFTYVVLLGVVSTFVRVVMWLMDRVPSSNIKTVWSRCAGALDERRSYPLPRHVAASL